MMSSTNEQDPFLQVQADVLQTLTQTRPLFTSYLRILSLSTSPSNPELLSAASDLRSSLNSLTEDLQDLMESVKVVQGDPYKYGLEIEEVARRKRLVDEIGGEVADMKEELDKGLSSSSQSKSKGKNRENGNSRPISDEEEGENGGEREDYTAEFEQQQQLHMMAEQDQVMDGVFRTVGNLRQQANDMGRELEEQGEMLEDVDGVVDRVGGKLQGGLKSMGTLIRRNEDRWSSCCIALLIFVLILLLVLVLVL